MIRARRRVFWLILILAVAASITAIMVRRRPPLPDRPIAERPTLMLLTSLPLVFGEDFSLQGGGSPALARLQGRYNGVSISVASASELAKGQFLIMAQPPAQTAENLVALDSWVRNGGRGLLLADPMLEWPSKLPLGDPLRPSPSFADTGLLAHWGLRLDAPEQRGLQSRKLGRFTVTTASPGSLTGRCGIQNDRLVARCRIGTGEVEVIADADLLNVDGIGSPGHHNLDGLIDELARMEPKVIR